MQIGFNVESKLHVKQPMSSLSITSGRQPFWQLLSDLGAEHDRQMSGLLTLVRELRLELNRATELDRETSWKEDLTNLRLELNLATEPQGNMTLEEELTSLKEDFIRLRKENLELKNKKVRAGDTGHAGNKTPPPPLVPKHQVQQPANVVAFQSMQPPTENQLPALAVGKCTEDDLNNGGTDKLAASKFHEADQPDGIGAADFAEPTVSEKMGFTKKLTRFVESPAFEMSAGCLILVNTLIMMIESQYVGLVSGYSTGLSFVQNNPEVTWKGADKVFVDIELAFTVIFTVELVVRFIALRCAIFKNPLNYIDIFSVSISLIQIAVEDVPINPTIFRIIRVARLSRGLRFVKFSRVLASLNILIKCIRASVNILFWSLCLLMIIQCIIGMVASQFAQEYIVDLSNPESKREELYMYYGTFTRAFVSMFEIHMANWATPCRIYMETLGEIWGDLFIFYRCIMGFALMSVIGAVFVQQTMSVVQNDQDIMILKKQKEAESYNRKLKMLFSALDKDTDNNLSRAEFDAVKEDADLKAWMSALDIEPTDLENLFNLLDSGDGMVSVEEFLMGASRVRGQAKSIDMAQLLSLMLRLERAVTDIRSHTCVPEGSACKAN